jgi:UDP-N-acetylmuramate dehydrogenase
MVIRHDVSLKQLNSFGLTAYARHFTELAHEVQINSLIQSEVFQKNPRLILGGGSNILLTGNFDGLVVKVALKGITVIGETDAHVIVRAAAGEDWPGFVEYCVDNNWGGLENLTLIPGNVGAAPMQNIGAYGVEIKDTFDHLSAYDLETGKEMIFGTDDCQFGYRDSIFKKKENKHYLIKSVCFKLTKENHQINTHYGSVKAELEAMAVKNPDIKDVMHAIQRIRRSKLPDPSELGNAGSFFKNPVLGSSEFRNFRQLWPDAPSFPDASGGMKIAAGWLIEQAGWRGFRDGDAGVHKDQALVLVNYGGASGHEILALARKIQDSVFKMFEIKISTEVNIV